MNIAFVQAVPFVPGAIDLPGYADLMVAEGHHVVFVSPGYNTSTDRHPAVIVPVEQMESAHFWNGLSLSAAVTLLWFNAPAVTEALRAAGVKVLSIADTDGAVSVRRYPAAFVTNMIMPAASFRRRWREAKSLVHRYLVRHQQEINAIVRTWAASDVITVETPTALARLKATAETIGCGHLTNRLRLVPHAVSLAFVAGPVATASERPTGIVSTGRLTAAQKNGPMLADAVARVVRAAPGTTAVLAGTDRTGIFARLVESAGVSCLGVVSRNRVCVELMSARVFVSAAWWESQPIAALEALCCGCTVVGMPIPGYRDLVAAGPFGRVAKRFSPRQLAQAVIDELECWAAGGRDPLAIANYWRTQVAEPVVVKQLMSALLSTPSMAMD